MATKVCKKCGKEHPLEFYDWANKAKGWRKSYCKSCSVKIYADWKLDNEKQHEAWFKKYYKNNPEMFGKTGKPKGRPMETPIKSGVYLITNTITGETYVGCSSDIKRRVWRHLDYNRGRSKSKKIWKSIKDHGREAHVWEVLEYCEKDIMFEREAFHMENYGCELNGNKAKK